MIFALGKGEWNVSDGPFTILHLVAHLTTIPDCLYEPIPRPTVLAVEVLLCTDEKWDLRTICGISTSVIGFSAHFAARFQFLDEPVLSWVWAEYNSLGLTCMRYTLTLPVQDVRTHIPGHKITPLRGLHHQSIPAEISTLAPGKRKVTHVIDPSLLI
ncbi:hypothetical protein BDV25DRAFT_88069 [Aspergillus avenaceus]|uniref:Uncharacterized protein n=1 Tax=Aspergillus avenaceus TaxID=36643 RepID=A0A5N6TE89_ASPAV|nr:hypothetical protein BDV25DRAFT_88069 [Aspergillus avenaceus]